MRHERALGDRRCSAAKSGRCLHICMCMCIHIYMCGRVCAHIRICVSVLLFVSDGGTQPTTDPRQPIHGTTPPPAHLPAHPPIHTPIQSPTHTRMRAAGSDGPRRIQSIRPKPYLSSPQKSFTASFLWSPPVPPLRMKSLHIHPPLCPQGPGAELRDRHRAHHRRTGFRHPRLKCLDTNKTVY